MMPSELTVLAWDTLFCQFICDSIHALAGQITAEDSADYRGFLLIGNQNVIDKLVSIGSIACDKIPALHTAQITPAHIIGDG